MPAPIPLPAGWSEVQSNDVPGITAAFARLEATFPKRYLHLNVPALQEKMQFVRQDQSVTPAVSVPACRIFSRSDMSFFYFLRFEYEPRAFCFSVGIDAGVTSGPALRDRFLEVGKYMQAQPGITTIDIVNQRELPGDLDDTDRARVVGAAFTVAINDKQLAKQSDIEPGPPWPSVLKRWTLATI